MKRRVSVIYFNIIDVMNITRLFNRYEDPVPAFAPGGRPFYFVNPTLAYVVRGELMQDWNGIMAEFSAVLQFPYYFDFTEEMFDKCMRDLRWLKSENVFLIIRDYEKILSSQEEREQFLERLGRNIDAASERLRRVYNIERNIYIVCQSET